MTLITDELVTRIGRALDELPHNTPNRDKARAALVIAAIEITEACAKVALNCPLEAGMTVRPIIFSAPMVRALLEGRKTQTRRLATSPLAKCKPGDLLYVRESLRLGATSTSWCYAEDGKLIFMEWPDHRIAQMVGWAHHKEGNSCPSIHMPRWASRITLAVTGVRVHRLREINVIDARAEGFAPLPDGGDEWHAFLDFWNVLHGDGATDANPEVVALTFTVHKQNIDDFLRQREAA